MNVKIIVAALISLGSGLVSPLSAEEKITKEVTAAVDKQALEKKLPNLIVTKPEKPAAAPDFTAIDTNPSSPTYKQKLSINSFKGSALLVIYAFDCDC